jgi:cation:H+ antiporter
VIDYVGLPVWANVLAFVAGGGVIWIAGTRLSRAIDVVSDRARIGKAFAGALLLGGITSLPEAATIATSSIAGRADIAVPTLFGGVAMQVAILAAVDAATTKHALSRGAAAPSVILQGLFLIAALVIACAGMVVGEVELVGVGGWTVGVLGVVVVGLRVVKRADQQSGWKVDPGTDSAQSAPSEHAERVHRRTRQRSTRRLVGELVAASAAVVIGGIVVAQSGEALADQTGLGGSYMGMVFIAIATSLPEISTTLEAVRLGQPVMAFSNIFGTNLFDAGLLFVADAAYPGPPVLDEMDRFAQFGALLGVMCTVIYLAGILLRRKRTVWRMGVDSALVLGTYLAGVALLYTLR